MPGANSERSGVPKWRVSFSSAQTQTARIHTQQRWRAQQAKTEGKRSEASDANRSIRIQRPAPRLKQAEGSPVYCPANRSWVSQAHRLSGTLVGKLSRANEANNGTGGQSHADLPPNPMASTGSGALLVGHARSNPVRKDRVAQRTVHQKKHTHYKTPTLPEVEGLLE